MPWQTERFFGGKGHKDAWASLGRRGLAMLENPDRHVRINTVDGAPLDFTSVSTVLGSIMADFFGAGVNPLQVLSITRALRSSSIAVAGLESAAKEVAPKTMYANPTPGKLAHYLFHAFLKNDGTCEIEHKREQEGVDKSTSLLQSLVFTYATDLPTRPREQKPLPSSDGQTVMLTGSTGAPGTYPLDRLCKSPHTQCIWALNREKDGGKSRQPGLSNSRSLGTDFGKVKFISAQMSRPDLGL
ncbi:hypothetical protein QQS21_006742 [Conoideocrella luteorostrata]|uniref:Polyketide synthase n=1 Tax=Conoideocrella luteorostrata TaxID=1105319 RepID=A0AAJ0CM34_9HYPO|nr:hypothetical protein QQS21_006742 [Conoideocrella luteorostrata]